jgi:enoyl-CoA hydratase
LEQDRYRHVLIDHRANGVTVATLNRPEKLNAVNGRLHYELANLGRDADLDRRTKVLVITGSGRAFCAGGDFSSGSVPDAGAGDPAANGVDMMLEARMIVDGLLECTKPVLAAVGGFAMGLGATVALLCDIVVADRSATFADTHVSMGIGAGDGGQLIWPLLMGVNRAKYFLMTGDRLQAEEAERLGLVNFVTEDGRALARALEIADRLAAGPTAAITASKVPINTWIRAQSAQILPLSLKMEELTIATDDAREAGRAFVEKRPPRFTGR